MLEQFDEIMSPDQIAGAQGHLQAALTLINAAARRVWATRPDLGDDLFQLGAAVVASIRKLNGEAPASASTHQPETAACPR